MITDSRMRELLNHMGPGPGFIHTLSGRGHDRAVYMNSEIDPLVSEVIIQKNEYTYRLRAYFANEFNYIRANMFLAQHKIFEPDYHLLNSRYSITVETADLRLLTTAIKELVRISPGLQHHVNNIQVRFSLNMNHVYQQIADMPKWDHIYTYNSLRNANTDEFRCLSNTRKIKKIDLLHETVRPCHNITVVFNTHQDYEGFRSLLVSNRMMDIRENSVLNNTIIVHVEHNDPRSIQKAKDFIALVLRFDPSIDETMARILLREPMPIVPQADRDELYYSDDEDDEISHVLDLLGRTTDPFRFQPGSESNANFEARNGFSEFYARARQQFGRQDTDIQQAEAQSFAEHYGHTGATYRLSQSAAAAPDSGANAKALAGIDVDVPDHLTCPLSLEIMTNPVRFAGLSSQQCFEEAWLMEHLCKSKVNPLTMETVNKEMLVGDLIVKRECDALANYEVQKNANKSINLKF